VIAPAALATALITVGLSVRHSPDRRSCRPTGRACQAEPGPRRPLGNHRALRVVKRRVELEEDYLAITSIKDGSRRRTLRPPDRRVFERPDIVAHSHHGRDASHVPHLVLDLDLDLDLDDVDLAVQSEHRHHVPDRAGNNDAWHAVREHGRVRRPRRSEHDRPGRRRALRHATRPSGLRCHRHNEPAVNAAPTAR